MEQTYQSSRWTSGNFLFPDMITLAEDGIHYTKRRFFGSNEEHINYRAVSSMKVSSGMFFANICIETSGGSQPVMVQGLSKNAAKEIKETVSQKQTPTH